MDEDSRRIEVVKQVHQADEIEGCGLITRLLGDEAGYSLDDSNVPAIVAREGKMRVGDSANDPVGACDPPVVDKTEPPSRDVAYFVPIKTEDRVIGVLELGSSVDEREEMLRHIDAMRPMPDQVAFALDHALLYRALQDYARVLAKVNAAIEREIEEPKRAEEAVVRLERLGALEEMLAGVSHNLNNILTRVLGSAELIGLMTGQKDVLHEADLIRTSAMRARDLVMCLHDSVRGEQKRVGSVNVDQVVEAAIETGKPRWKDEPESLSRQICLT